MTPDLPDVTELAIPGFVALVLLELALVRRTGRGRYETRDALTSLAMGAGSIAEGVLLGFLSYSVLMVVHRHFALWQLGFTLPVFVIGFLLDDLRFYWYHRLAHERRWLWAAHVIHHSSQHYNLSTALRQTWTGTFALGWLVRVPLVILGFHPAMLVFLDGVNLVYQFWVHTELIGRLPRPVEWLFNTPSHHRVHHARNVRYLDANYGGTLIIWDRLFGSFIPEGDEACRYGLVKNVATFNPVRIALHEWAAIARDITMPGLTWGQRLRYATGPPGYSHDGSRMTTAQLRDAAASREDSAINTDVLHEV